MEMHLARRSMGDRDISVGRWCNLFVVLLFTPEFPAASTRLCSLTSQTQTTSRSVETVETVKSADDFDVGDNTAKQLATQRVLTLPNMAHAHPHPHPTTSSGVPPPGAIQVSAPDPSVVAAIDSQFQPVNLKLGGDHNNSIAQCNDHGLEVCKDCGVDFYMMNQTARLLKSFPKEVPIPPPPNVIHPQRSPMIQKAKDEGNVSITNRIFNAMALKLITNLVCLLTLLPLQQLFKRNKHPEAIQKYDLAANIAAARFPWEASAIMRDELAIVICNRSASYFASGDFVGALADADAVIQLKRPWSKGHFRKAKALLALGMLEDAKESAELGLQFEPESAVCNPMSNKFTSR
jgi:translocation protein SEC72